MNNSRDDTTSINALRFNYDLIIKKKEAKLNDLLKTRDHITSLTNAKVKLNELYDRVLDNLENATPEIKALALDALDIKAYDKGNDDVEIKGVIPLELALPTTARTSA